MRDSKSSIWRLICSEIARETTVELIPQRPLRQRRCITLYFMFCKHCRSVIQERNKNEKIPQNEINYRKPPQRKQEQQKWSVKTSMLSVQQILTRAHFLVEICWTKVHQNSTSSNAQGNECPLDPNERHTENKSCLCWIYRIQHFSLLVADLIDSTTCTKTNSCSNSVKR